MDWSWGQYNLLQEHVFDEIPQRNSEPKQETLNFEYMIGTKSCMQNLLLAATTINKFRQIHAHLIISGTINNPIILNHILISPTLTESPYTNSIFTQISSPNSFIWNTTLKNWYTNHSPLLLYHKMISLGATPNGHTFMYLTKALTPRMDVIEGEEVHSHVVKFGYGSSEYVASGLIGFYVACGCVKSARKLFDEMSDPGLILWTSMIRGYVRVDCVREALEMFRESREGNVMIDSVALAIVVNACTKLRDLSVAKAMHGFIWKSGIEMDEFVSSAVLGMYGECGSLDYAFSVFCGIGLKNVVMWNTMIHQCVKHEELGKALELFRKMPCRDVVSWNTMIGGLCQMGRSKKAIAMFHEMEMVGVKPNRMTMLSTLSACATLGALDTGTWIHAYTEKNKLNLDGSLNASLIDMYAKCGSIDKALQVFEKFPKKEVFSWTSIICGLAMHGHGKEAVHQFLKMEEAEIWPDDVAFVGLLSACAHAGLLDQGRHYFHLMSNFYGLKPKIEHFGCMVDLLGRMGCLDEAYNLIVDMPMEPNDIIWGSLLSACRLHKNVELGELVAKKMLELDSSDPWIRVMLSNIYAEAGKWERAMMLRKDLKETGSRKAPGCSSIEVYGKVHEFLVGDTSHPQQDKIYSMLLQLEMTF